MADGYLSVANPTLHTGEREYGSDRVRGLSDQTIRATLKRLHVNWKRMKRWITRPDPEYAQKKARATA